MHSGEAGAAAVGVTYMAVAQQRRPAMTKFHRPKSVPKSMQATWEAIVALTDAFCDQHLNAEYRELARDMAAALARKRPSPLASGQPRSWACGIIYALGQVNFLADRATQPYMRMVDVCAAFGVNQNTASAKACAISNALSTHQLDPTWTLPSMIDQNRWCGWPRSTA
jgi:hypothetical protein